MSLSILNIHYSSPSFPHNLSKLHHSTADIIFLTGKFPRVREDLERERERERETSSYKILILVFQTHVQVEKSEKSNRILALALEAITLNNLVDILRDEEATRHPKNYIQIRN